MKQIFKTIISSLLCFLFFSYALQAQQATKSDSIETDKNSIIPLPVVYYTPESGLFFGGSVLYNFYADRLKPINPSQIQLAAGYTTKNQLLIFSPFQLFWDQNKWRAFGEFGYYNYAYPFYGIGNTTDPNEFTNYRAKFPRANIFLLKEIIPNLSVGLRYWFEIYDIINWESSTSFPQVDYTGSEYNRTSGIGPAFVYDSRDGVYYPTDGIYFEGFVELNQRFLGATHEYTLLSLDYAQYFSLFDNSVLAYNIFNRLNFGEVPFNRLAQLGGNKKMRGYFQGYFQDNNLLLAQLEWRQFLFWRIGVVGFASAGQVAPSIRNYNFNRFNYAAGAGLRLLFDKEKKINVRLDYAIGKESSGVYISYNEAF